MPKGFTFFFAFDIVGAIHMMSLFSSVSPADFARSTVALSAYIPLYLSIEVSLTLHEGLRRVQQGDLALCVHLHSALPIVSLTHHRRVGEDRPASPAAPILHQCHRASLCY